MISQIRSEPETERESHLTCHTDEKNYWRPEAAPECYDDECGANS